MYTVNSRVRLLFWTQQETKANTFWRRGWRSEVESYFPWGMVLILERTFLHIRWYQRVPDRFAISGLRPLAYPKSLWVSLLKSSRASLSNLFTIQSDVKFSPRLAFFNLFWKNKRGQPIGWKRMDESLYLCCQHHHQKTSFFLKRKDGKL